MRPPLSSQATAFNRNLTARLRSRSAATLRWLKDTDKQAVLIVHRDGYMDWAFSSKAALKKAHSSDRVSSLSKSGSLAATESIAHEREGNEIAARTWFPHVPAELSLHEMKITADGYDSVMTLLLLPRGASVWQPWEERHQSV